MDYRTTTDLVAALRARAVSSAALVEDTIRRIEADDGRLNAVVVRDFDRAREAARAADARLERGEEGPLLGVPMTVKECFNVTGLPTTWGVPGTEKARATSDAVAVARLKAAGAIILGKTNNPFMLGDWQCANEVYGVTNNPWDVTRTPGGSSGGAAAALAAGYVPLELGSDLAGSLRAPAHFCGIFAHKPTHGIVPMRGAEPPGTPDLTVATPVDLAVVGPMARSAADLALALDVIAGPDDLEATGYRLDLPPPRHAALKDFRILVLDQHPQLPTEERIRACLSALAERLARAGCTVGRASPLMPDLATIGGTFVELLMSFIGADLPETAYREARARADRVSRDDRDFAAASARGLALSHRDWVRNDRIRAAMKGKWCALFRDWDVVLCPAMPTVAFPHDHRKFDEREITIDGARVKYGRQMMWASVATFTGQPATVMPIGLSEDNLPIGMQIIGPYLEDRTTIAFGRLVEQAFGGFVPPPRG